jgi:hypothetical protein
MGAKHPLKAQSHFGNLLVRNAEDLTARLRRALVLHW